MLDIGGDCYPDERIFKMCIRDRDSSYQEANIWQEAVKGLYYLSHVKWVMTARNVKIDDLKSSTICSGGQNENK